MNTLPWATLEPAEPVTEGLAQSNQARTAAKAGSQDK